MFNTKNKNEGQDEAKGLSPHPQPLSHGERVAEGRVREAVDSGQSPARRRNSGQVLVLVALSLVVFLGFAALAIDFAYFYHTRHQLQGAADAAALAGASNLSKIPGDTSQTEARQEAIRFADANKAAGSSVILAPGAGGSNELTPGNDITVGFWDGTRYQRGATPVNAVQVRARRTGASSPLGSSPGGPVGTFFGKIFGINTVNIGASAIAQLPARASSYITLCIKGIDNCTNPLNIVSFNPPRVFETGPTEPYENAFAWTTLLQQVSSTDALRDLICNINPYVEVCGESIWSTMGTNADVHRDFESVMYDPTYDAANKVIAGGVVTSWTVILPITESCPPGAQGNQWDPKPVSHYAKMRIIAVCGPTGGGASCKPYSAPAGTCGPGGQYPAKSIVIDRYSCVGCGEKELMIGLSRPSLVE